MGRPRAASPGWRVCQHSTAGTLWGTDTYFRRGAASTGLTDYGIGGATDGERWDGVILRWNDPLGRAHLGVSSNRAGWANGGSDGLEGDGPAFVNALGIAAINRDLVSIERSDGGNLDTPMSHKQFESICLLTAYWFDQAKVQWDRFPVHPDHGFATHMLHCEFSTKACPYAPVTGQIDRIQSRVRELLRAAQTAPHEPAPAGAMTARRVSAKSGRPATPWLRSPRGSATQSPRRGRRRHALSLRSERRDQQWLGRPRHRRTTRDRRSPFRARLVAHRRGRRRDRRSRHLRRHLDVVSSIPGLDVAVGAVIGQPPPIPNPHSLVPSPSRLKGANPMDLTDAVIVALVPAVVEAAKRAELPVRLAGLAAILAATALVALRAIANGESDLAPGAETILRGLVLGLAAAGLYTQARVRFNRSSATDSASQLERFS